jgi:hypothetical protein
MASSDPRQLDLLRYAAEQDEVLSINAGRLQERAFVVLATDPAIDPSLAGYRELYATSARSGAEAVRKVRPQAGKRRLRAFVATGKYREEYLAAEWIE